MAAIVAWATALPLAAVAAASATPGSLPWFGSRLVFGVGAVVCHQRPERSFHLHGEPLPVCARCLGVYGGAAVAALAVYLGGATGVMRRRRAPRDERARARGLMIGALLPNAATLGWEWLVRMPPHVVRAGAGIPLGVIVAWLVLQPPRGRVQSE